MAVDTETLAKLREEPDKPISDLEWMNMAGEWGVKAVPGRRGLTLEDISIGSYGEVAEESSNHGFAARGVARRPEAPRTRVAYQTAADVWSNNTRLLYEEAVARQWSSATDIPWEEVQELPEELERAMCQYCTFLTEVEFIAGDVPGQWLPQISPEYYESKLFLASQIMDEARHLDVFRKRLFVNGGGMLSQTPESGLNLLLNAKDFTEASSMMHILAEGFVQSLFRMGEYLGPSEVDKKIFRMCAQDESRHLAFGVMHLKYVLEKSPERREEIHSYLDNFENVLAGPSPEELTTGVVMTQPQQEALVILFAGGKDNLDEGYQKMMAANKRQVNEYMQRLEVAGLGDRRERMNPMMRAALN
jgi:hypothetical protein